MAGESGEAMARKRRAALVPLATMGFGQDGAVSYRLCRRTVARLTRARADLLAASRVLGGSAGATAKLAEAAVGNFLRLSAGASVAERPADPRADGRARAAGDLT